MEDMECWGTGVLEKKTEKSKHHSNTPATTGAHLDTAAVRKRMGVVALE
jgi:hypothetical protein